MPTSTSYNESLVLALSDETSTITGGASKLTFRAPCGMVLYQIPRASVNTASTYEIIIDIKQNGVSILGNNKLRIDAFTKSSVTSTKQTTLSTTFIPDDAEVTFDVTSSGTNGKGLKVVLYYRRA